MTATALGHRVTLAYDLPAGGPYRVVRRGRPVSLLRGNKKLMRIGLNIHGQHVPDRERLLTFLGDTRPAWTLVMDDLDLAKTVKARVPETNVIYRYWGTDGDEDDAQDYTPAQWVAERKRMIGNADLWAYTTNEPAFDEATLAWLTEVVKLSAEAGLKVVVGNWAVGNPTDVDNDWPRAKALLKALDQHRDTAVMALHEYACGVITSGFVGGLPTSMIAPETWPEDVSQIGALWHCGRFGFAMRYCEKVGIKPPRIVITEHGFDDLSDIKPWTEKLLRTPTFGNPGGNIRGWMTLQRQWNEWFNHRGWSPERAYFEQLKYADQKVYQGSVVEAQLIFCWGHSGDAWAQFDVAEAKELHGLMAGYAVALPDDKTPQYPPAPANSNKTPPPAPLPDNEEGEKPDTNETGGHPKNVTEKQLADIITALEKWIGAAEGVVEALKVVCAVNTAEVDTKSG